MPLSKKDYEVVAASIAFALCYTQERYLHTEILINRLCDYFKHENPRFNEDKFREACLDSDGE